MKKTVKTKVIDRPGQEHLTETAPRSVDGDHVTDAPGAAEEDPYAGVSSTFSTMSKEEIVRGKNALVEKLEIAHAEASEAAAFQARKMAYCLTNSMVLSGKYRVRKSTYEITEYQFNDIHPTLMKDIDYGPAELVGFDYWGKLSNVEKHIAILCLKDLAKLNCVPMVETSCSKCEGISFQVI